MRDLAATRLVICTFAAVLHGTSCQTRIHFFFEQVRELDHLGPPANSVVPILVEVTSLTCVNRCVASDWCASVFYDMSTSRCLLTAQRYLSAAGLIPALGLQYWREECPVAMGYHLDPVFDSCIRVTHHPNITLETAQTACKNDKSELINLDSMGKFSALRQFLNTSFLFYRPMTAYYRVAGQRPPISGVFDFALDNGRAFPFGNGSSAWGVNQPNNRDWDGDGVGDQNCLGLHLNDLLFGDVECYARLCSGYICERLLASL